MRVLLTGWRGFIGGALLRRLKDLGVTVVTYEGDVRDIATYSPQCDVVVHLAARARTGGAPKDFETMETNVVGALAVAEYARRSSCPVVFTSTCAVYSPETNSERLSENHPTGPREANGSSKLLAEKLIIFSARLHGFGVIVLRLFNIYGTGQPKGFLVPDLIHALSVKEPIRLLNPAAVRDFVHVDDVCEAIWKAVGASGQRDIRVFNIGTGVGTAVVEVARVLARLGEAGEDWILTGSGGDNSVIVADPTAAFSQLQWKPQRDLLSGLRATLQSRS